MNRFLLTASLYIAGGALLVSFANGLAQNAKTDLERLNQAKAEMLSVQ